MQEHQDENSISRALLRKMIKLKVREKSVSYAVIIEKSVNPSERRR